MGRSAGFFSSLPSRARCRFFSSLPSRGPRALPCIFVGLRIVPARPRRCVSVPRKRARLVEFPSVDDRAVAPTAATVATRVVAVPRNGGLATGSFGPVFGARLARQRVDPARRRLPPRAGQARPRPPKRRLSLLCLWAASHKASLLSLPLPSAGEKSSLLFLPSCPTRKACSRAHSSAKNFWKDFFL